MYRDFAEGKITTPIHMKHQFPTYAQNCAPYAEASEETLTHWKCWEGRGRSNNNYIPKQHSNLLNTELSLSLKAQHPAQYKTGIKYL